MRPAVAVPAGTGLAEALQAAELSSVDEVVLLGPDDHPAAVLDGRAIATVPSELITRTPAAAVARVLPAHAVVQDSLAADSLVRHLQAHAHHEYVVVDATGTVRGVLLWDDVVAEVSGLQTGRSGRLLGGSPARPRRPDDVGRGAEQEPT